MSTFRGRFVFCFALAFASMASLDVEATGRARCRKAEAPVPPGSYSIVVAGADQGEVVDAIRRVVSEEKRARPALFKSSTIEVYDSGAQMLGAQKAVAVVAVGSASPPASYAEGPDRLLIVVPKIYETSDPQYVKSVKIDTAGIHLALRSILFFSGEAKETDEFMGTEHFVSLPDEFAGDGSDERHKH